MRAIEFQYDLFRKKTYRGPNVGICSKPFNLAAARKEIHCILSMMEEVIAWQPINLFIFTLYFIWPHYLLVYILIGQSEISKPWLHQMISLASLYDDQDCMNVKPLTSEFSPQALSTISQNPCRKQHPYFCECPYSVLYLSKGDVSKTRHKSPP